MPEKNLTNVNSEPTEVHVRSEQIEMAIKWVCNRVNYTIDRGEMNPRRISEKLDDGIMGEIASVAVMQFLSEKGRFVISYDQIRTDQYKEADPGWDILSSKNPFDEWLLSTGDIKVKPEDAFSFSIKSSRIPPADKDDINLSIQKRDFKIFAKSQHIENDLTSDFEVQVYYPLQPSIYKIDLVITEDDIKERNVENIAKGLKLVERYSRCYLSGAASRSVLIEYSNSLPKIHRVWNSYHMGHSKPMWVAPLRLGKSFSQMK